MHTHVHLIKRELSGTVLLIFKETEMYVIIVHLVSPVKRAPGSHHRHQPPHDGRFRRTFHEASRRSVSPAGDQREGAPGQISAARSPPQSPTVFPIIAVTLG